MKINGLYLGKFMKLLLRLCPKRLIVHIWTKNNLRFGQFSSQNIFWKVVKNIILWFTTTAVTQKVFLITTKKGDRIHYWGDIKNQ